MKRIELKFKLNQSQYFLLKERISSLMDVDRGGKYPVFSKYYDTENMDFLYDKINGELYHLKIRMRKYSYDLKDSSQSFLEAKIKEDCWGMKHRVKYEGEKSLSPFFKSFVSSKPLKPICNIFYEREAFEKNCNGKKLRVNFDTNLMFLDEKENLVDIQRIKTRGFSLFGLGFYAILEVKYTEEDLPTFIEKELNMLNIERTSFSKYGHGAIAVFRDKTERKEF